MKLPLWASVTGTDRRTGLGDPGPGPGPGDLVLIHSLSEKSVLPVSLRLRLSKTHCQ